MRTISVLLFEVRHDPLDVYYLLPCRSTLLYLDWRFLSYACLRFVRPVESYTNTKCAYQAQVCTVYRILQGVFYKSSFGVSWPLVHGRCVPGPLSAPPEGRRRPPRLTRRPAHGGRPIRCDHDKSCLLLSKSKALRMSGGQEPTATMLPICVASLSEICFILGLQCYESLHPWISV